MALDGPAFYDDEEIFTYYTAKRMRSDSANETLERPIFEELTGDLAGLRLLDLGCGDGRFGLTALEAGARFYLGVEGSQKMFELARDTLAHADIAEAKAQVIQARIEDWPYPSRAFDLVTARLVLHYIEDIDSLLRKIQQTIVEGGRFICSVEHPVITSCNRAWLDGGHRQEWIVDDYFETGRRVTNWMGGEVIKYHRTVEDYWSAFHSAGLEVDAIRESRPSRDHIADEATYQRRKRIPLMLFFAAFRPN